MPGVPFTDLPDADLHVDSIFHGGIAGNMGDDPIDKLLGVGLAGGFRYTGSPTNQTVPLVALVTLGTDPDWPDTLDVRTGTFTYYGDNKKPGHPLHDTPRKGNVILRDAFANAHNPAGRIRVPPFLAFERAGTGRDVRFLGLMAPGAPGVPQDEQLVAIWRSLATERFQNYRAIFTVLDVPIVTRAWIADVQAGKPLSDNCPPAWHTWVEGGAFTVLAAPPEALHRTRDQQLPQTPEDVRILRTIHEHFAGDSVGFEHCAAELWRMMAPAVEDVEVTRPSRDGGRDAIGHYSLGPAEDRVRLEFALEAKCYAPTNTVGVREVSRLISRLRFRQFGVFVTTSWVQKQAYTEVRTDGHPVVFICGGDIVRLLKARGWGTATAVQAWLSATFPRSPQSQ